MRQHKFSITMMAILAILLVSGCAASVQTAVPVPAQSTVASTQPDPTPTETSCIAKDGNVSAWTDSSLGVILFTVRDCEIQSFQFALNPKVIAQNSDISIGDGQLPTIMLFDNGLIDGNQFVLNASKGNGTVSLAGSFASATEVSGSIRISKGTHFDTHPNLYLNEDIVDSWKGTIE